MSNKNSTKKSQTDWARIDAMTDEDIDFTDLPEITDEMWEKGVLQKGAKTNSLKSQEILIVDSDIIEFFKSEGRGYKSKINQLLRAYMESHQAK